MEKSDLLFSNISIKDKARVYSITTSLPQYCDYSLLNLLIWSNDAIPTKIAIYNNNLVVKMKDFITDNPIIGFCGINSVDETIGSLVDYLQEDIRLVPNETIEKLNRNKYVIEEERDQFDYILELSSIASLSGKSYSSKRGKINNFKKQFPKAEIRTLDLSNSLTQKHILDLSRKWRDTKISQQNNEIDFDINPVTKCIQFEKYFDLLTLGLYVNNALIGYTINECPTRGMARGVLGLVDVRFVGASQFLENETAKKLINLGYTEINIEQDLGLHGLRTTKLSWKPKYFLKKYSIKSS